MSASNRLRNPSIGLTGMACSLAPGTSAVFGVEPILSESRSYGTGGRWRQITRRAGKIEVDDLVLVEPRPGETRQRTGVDMGIVEAVMAGDETGQHAGIGRVHLAADQREAHARDRLHAEHAQHRDVRVAGADQHDVLDHGMGQRLACQPLIAGRYSARRLR